MSAWCDGLGRGRGVPWAAFISDVVALREAEEEERDVAHVGLGAVQVLELAQGCSLVGLRPLWCWGCPPAEPLKLRAAEPGPRRVSPAGPCPGGQPGPAGSPPRPRSLAPRSAPLSASPMLPFPSRSRLLRPRSLRSTVARAARGEGPGPTPPTSSRPRLASSSPLRASPGLTDSQAWSQWQSELREPPGPLAHHHRLATPGQRGNPPRRSLQGG